MKRIIKQTKSRQTAITPHSSFSRHFPTAFSYPGGCQALLDYIGFLGGGKPARKRTGANSGQANSGLENQHGIYYTEIHVTHQWKGWCRNVAVLNFQEKRSEPFLLWMHCSLRRQQIPVASCEKGRGGGGGGGNWRKMQMIWYREIGTDMYWCVDLVINISQPSGDSECLIQGIVWVWNFFCLLIWCLFLSVWRVFLRTIQFGSRHDRRLSKNFKGSMNAMCEDERKRKSSRPLVPFAIPALQFASWCRQENMITYSLGVIYSFKLVFLGIYPSPLIPNIWVFKIFAKYCGVN